MSTNIPNQSPFLPRQRNFPLEPQPLSVELDRMYTLIASAVNNRTLSTFTNNKPIQTGEQWHLAGLIFSGFRQYYPITGPGTYAHGINTSNISTFTKIYGTYTDGTNWGPLPWVSETAANNQISMYVTSTSIIITAGAGTPPTISSGIVVLEWISSI